MVARTVRYLFVHNGDIKFVSIIDSDRPRLPLWAGCVATFVAEEHEISFGWASTLAHAGFWRLTTAAKRDQNHEAGFLPPSFQNQR